ncbi:MAG: glycosyltransferase family 2 protein [Planctomycetota bacterium]|jgi:glycosyltransferase involved in cell wall biosynthesis
MTADLAPRTAATDLDLSVVVPVYNEVLNLRELRAAIGHALEDLGHSYEVVFVDDGSTDGSRELMREMTRTDPRLRVVLFRRNYGQTAAMSAGFSHARGAVVVTMDADLQNDPADIPRLLAELERGQDIVVGWRRHRKDRMLSRNLPSKLANRLIAWVTGVKIHDTGCSLKAYRGWVVRSLDLYSDMHRFIAALAAGAGARISEVPVRHHPRRFGKSKYGLTRIYRVLADLVVIKSLIQFAVHPVRGFLLLSLPLFLAAPLLYFVGFFKFDEGSLTLPSKAEVFHLTSASVALLVAMNLFLLGYLAELQLRVSGRLKRRAGVRVSNVSDVTVSEVPQ